MKIELSPSTGDYMQLARLVTLANALNHSVANGVKVLKELLEFNGFDNVEYITFISCVKLQFDCTSPKLVIEFRANNDRKSSFTVACGLGNDFIGTF